jgi:hypothetical protein
MAGAPVRVPCKAWEVRARANRVMTVRLVGFIPGRGAPKSGRFLAVVNKKSKRKWLMVYENLYISYCY